MHVEDPGSEDAVAAAVLFVFCLRASSKRFARQQSSAVDAMRHPSRRAAACNTGYRSAPQNTHRTTPLKLDKSEVGKRRIPSRPSSASFYNNPAMTHTRDENGALVAKEAVVVPGGPANISPPNQGGFLSSGTGLAKEERGWGAPSWTERCTGGVRRLQPVLLSWESVGLSIHMPGLAGWGRRGLGGGEFVDGFCSDR